jgi:mRNA-degrading endonuclease RelE of RelBE toxin-antitoxin system
MYSDTKTTRLVADAVTKIMMGEKALHPNQQKLDVHEPEKDELTADDFKKLRAGKKAPEVKKEEVEQIQEYESKGGVYRHKGTYGTEKSVEAGYTDYDKENELAKKNLKDKPNRKKYGARQNFVRSTRVNESFSALLGVYKESGLKGLEEALVKEEPTNDQYNAELEDAKAKAEGKKKQPDLAKGSVQAVKNEEIEVLDADKVNGVQIDTIDLTEDMMGYKIRQKHQDKWRVHSPSGEHIGNVTKHENGYQYHGGHATKWNGSENSPHYKTGVVSSKSEAAKKVASIHKSSLSENVEHLDEDMMGYKARQKHDDKWRIHSPSGEHIGNVTKHENGWQYHGGHATKWNGSENSPHYKTGVEKTRAAASRKVASIHKSSLSEDVRELDEREMTEPEMKKREGIVKSMKKGMTGFKERYGERAKNVMYATATKQAMKD